VRGWHRVQIEIVGGQLVRKRPSDLSFGMPRARKPNVSAGELLHTLRGTSSRLYDAGLASTARRAARNPKCARHENESAAFKEANVAKSHLGEDHPSRPYNRGLIATMRADAIMGRPRS
jgi:hypothetical protein